MTASGSGRGVRLPGVHARAAAAPRQSRAARSTWEQIAAEAGITTDIREFTTVTGKLRRVGRFDPERRAIQVNQPSRIVLNHLDYVDPRVREGFLPAKARAFVEKIEAEIGRQ